MLKKEVDIVLDSIGEEALQALDDATDSAIGRRRILMTKAVGAAWETFCSDKQSVIIQSFRHLGMTLPIDGSADHELHVKGVAGLEVGDWRLMEPVEVEVEDARSSSTIHHQVVPRTYQVEKEMDREGEDYNGLAYDYQT
ncbi:hypothetical protein HOY82DRAFT_597370 [Tuber indicum]|nr:hypothetical protein HOY82DRAFT_597370 [Tuber indicum]